MSDDGIEPEWVKDIRAGELISETGFLQGD